MQQSVSEVVEGGEILQVLVIIVQKLHVHTTRSNFTSVCTMALTVNTHTINDPHKAITAGREATVHV